MTVAEVKNQFCYGTRFFLKGAYSGKIYYRSWINKDELLDRYLSRECPEHPIFTTMDIRPTRMVESNTFVNAVIGIWMHDYPGWKGGEDDTV